MFKRQLNRAPWAIEKLQETLLWEREEEQIKFLRKEETDRVFEEESCTFSRIDLLYNLDSHSTKCRVIHDFTGMVKGSTLSLEIFLGEDGFDSLSECGFFRMAQYGKEFDVSKYFIYVNPNNGSIKNSFNS